MDVIKTLKYMKPDIKVMVAGNDIDQIFYNEDETFRPTKEEILAVDQKLVESFVEFPLERSMEALADSDITVLRALEVGKVIPAEWIKYRADLRKVVNGASTTMPIKPKSYP